MKDNFLWKAIVVVVIAVGLWQYTHAATTYSAGTLLQTGDVLSRHILDGTIVNADISGSAAITLQKLYAGTTFGNIFFDSYGRIGTSTSFTFATTTGLLTVSGGAILQASSTVSGGLTVSGNATTTGNQVISGNLTLSGTCSGCSAPYLTQQYTVAAGTVTAGNAVTMATSTETSLVSGGGTDNVTANATVWAGQKFTTTSTQTGVTKVTTTLYDGGAPVACAGTVEIQTDNAGSPSGTAVSGGTSSFSTTCNSNNTTITTTFAGSATVSPSTSYWIVYKGVSGAQVAYRWGTADTGTSLTSSNSGASWSGLGHTFDYAVYDYFPAQGTIVIASAAGGTGGATGFIGFAKTTAAAGAVATVYIAGQVTGLSGLTAGTPYYLSNTAGALSSSAGTVSKKACIADSKTSCVITNVW